MQRPNLLSTLPLVITLALAGAISSEAQPRDGKALMQQAQLEWMIEGHDRIPRTIFNVSSRADEAVPQEIRDRGARRAAVLTLSDDGHAVEWRVIEFVPLGTTAFEISEARTLDRDGEVAQRKRFIVIWENEDDRWQLSREIAVERS